MSDYVTVAEAVSESGKSLSSVRRALKKLPSESVRKQGNKYLSGHACTSLTCLAASPLYASSPAAKAGLPVVAVIISCSIRLYHM